MRATVSVPPSVGYVDREAVRDMREGMSVDDAAYKTVHGYPGGVAAVAARLGTSAGTLNHKVNPNNTTHYLNPRELLAIQHITGDASITQAMAYSLGLSCVPAMPDQSGGDPVEAIMRASMAWADFLRSVADPLQLPGGKINRNQMRRIEAMAADLQAAMGDVLAAVRGLMPEAPEVKD